MAHFGFNRNCCVTRQSSRTELHFIGTECHTVLVESRVQLQETVSAGTGSRGVSCLSSLCWTIIPGVWWSDSKKRNSAIADKPARRVYRSVKVTKHSTIPYVRYSFLLCNNFVFKTRRFYDIPLQKCRDLEIGVRGHSRSLKMAKFNRFCMVSY